LYNIENFIIIIIYYLPPFKKKPNFLNRKLLFSTGKIIKLNYEVNETLKIYNDVLDDLNHKKPIDEENEESLLDLSMSSISPGKIYVLITSTKLTFLFS